MQPQIERYQHPEKHGHGGHGGHNEHDEHNEEDEGSGEGGSSEGGESAEEKSVDQGEGSEEESKEGNNNEGESDDSGSDGEGKDTPDTSDDEGSENRTHEKEGGQNVEGVQFKGATSGGTREGEQGDTRKHIPDAKGFNKKRIESDYGRKQGEARESEQDPSNKDMVSNAFYVAFSRNAVSLTRDRLLHPNLQVTRQHNRENRKGSRILTPNTPPTLLIAPRRAPKAKGARTQRKTKEPWILKDHRSKSLDDTIL